MTEAPFPNGNEKIIEELIKSRDNRLGVIAQADPEWNRLTGMIDFASGRITLKESEGSSDSEDE
jgi:hypothetical protein